MRAALERELKVDATLLPMVRGRLVAINDHPFETTRLSEGRARQLGEREFNLSWTETLPRGNRIVEGAWWKQGDTGGASLEEGIAETLGIKLGDTLTYDVAGTRVTAKVTSLRKVDWDSFRVNFFALFQPGLLEPLPKTFIAAVRSDGGNAAWLTSFVREFPNVLVIDVAALLHEVQTIMDEVARAIEFVFLFTLAGGVLVLEAAIAATQDERRFDAAVLRTLGASERQLSTAQVAEFLALGALAGLLAAAGATAVGYVLADRVFQIPFSGNPLLWIVGVTGAAACVAIAGWLGTRSTLRQPPLAVLRRLSCSTYRLRWRFRLELIFTHFALIWHYSTHAHRPCRKTTSNPASSPIFATGLRMPAISASTGCCRRSSRCPGPRARRRVTTRCCSSSSTRPPSCG